MVAWGWLIVAWVAGFLFSYGLVDYLNSRWPVDHSADSDDVTSQYDSTED